MSVEMSVDVKPIFEAMGVIDGIQASIESDAYVDALLNTTISELKDRFNVLFTAASMSNPDKYHHVWEWGGIGAEPLFFLTRSGKGKHKKVGFNFRQSLKAVPKPDPDKTGIPEENINRLRRRSIFRFKALVMETGTAVHITTRRAKVLFVPTPGAENKKGEVVNFIFRKQVTLRNVGGEAATGAFSLFWTGFWNSEAPYYLHDVVAPRVEAQIDSVATRQLGMIRRGTISRDKTFTIQPIGALEAAHKAREEAAQKELTYYAQSFERDDEEGLEEEL